MKIGLCTASKNIERAIKIGYDYVVLSGTEVSAMSDDEFEGLVKRVKEGNINVLAYNALCTPDVKIAGPEYSYEKAQEYIKRLAKRGARLGIKSIGIGAPKSRQLPKGFDKNMAWEQGKEFIKMTAMEAEKYGMKVLIEYLHSKWNDFILSLEESKLMADEIGMDNVSIVTDFFQMRVDGVDFSEAKDYIKYTDEIHISGCDFSSEIPKRPFVNENDEAELGKIAEILKNEKYDKTLALEPDGIDGGFENKAQKSLEVIRKIFC